LSWPWSKRGGITGLNLFRRGEEGCAPNRQPEPSEPNQLHWLPEQRRGKTAAVWLLSQVRRAGLDEQRAVYDWLRKKFGD